MSLWSYCCVTGQRAGPSAHLLVDALGREVQNSGLVLVQSKIKRFIGSNRVIPTGNLRVLELLL